MSWLNEFQKRSSIENLKKIATEHVYYKKALNLYTQRLDAKLNDDTLKSIHLKQVSWGVLKTIVGGLLITGGFKFARHCFRQLSITPNDRDGIIISGVWLGAIATIPGFYFAKKGLTKIVKNHSPFWIRTRLENFKTIANDVVRPFYQFAFHKMIQE